MRTAILITGASTGIGYSCAGVLAEAGFAVFAGVRNDTDAARLRTGIDGAISPLTLDVRDANHISAAIDAIESSGIPLAGVVNNAGIAVAGPLEYLPLSELQRQFDVNVFGALAVTQASLPLLRRSHGRIVFISSVSGQLAPPYLGPYAASKFALEAMADSLRMELSPFGIRVVVVQPGNVKTPIWAKGRAAKDDLLALLPQAAFEHYGGAIGVLQRLTEREERSGMAPEEVARKVLHALTTPKPRARYAVGNPPGWMRRIASLLPEHRRDRLILKNFRG